MVTNLYETDLLPRGYFHTKNERIVVNVDVLEWTRIPPDRWIDGWTR